MPGAESHIPASPGMMSLKVTKNRYNCMIHNYPGRARTDAGREKAGAKQGGNSKIQTCEWSKFSELVAGILM